MDNSQRKTPPEPHGDGRVCNQLFGPAMDGHRHRVCGLGLIFCSADVTNRASAYGGKFLSVKDVGNQRRRGQITRVDMETLKGDDGVSKRHLGRRSVGVPIREVNVEIGISSMRLQLWRTSGPARSLSLPAQL
jgi:hypothetical protein